MINPNELRRNNLIMYGNMVYPVDKITETSISVRLSSQSLRPARPHEFEPVALSSEILEACGFLHRGGWMGKFFTTSIYDDEVRVVFEIMDKVLVIYANDTRVRKIDTPALHQIMNAWQEFTGTELTINVEKVKV